VDWTAALEDRFGLEDALGPDDFIEQIKWRVDYDGD
jgi:hypothetical protein